MSSYLIPSIMLLIGLVLFLPDWFSPKIQWIGKIITGIALIELALIFLGGHYHHVFGRWPA